MSAKPTGSVALDHLWCESAPLSIIQPSTTKIGAGWKTGEKPPAQYINWALNRTDNWLRYLDDGAFTGGVTADTLGVSGALTASGGVSTTTIAASGNATVGGTLGSTGLVTASAGLTAGANQHVTLSGTGDVKHGIKTKVIAPNPTGIPPYATMDVALSVFNYTANLDGYFRLGDRIREVRLYVQDNTSGPTTLVSSLKTYAAPSGTPSTIGTSNTSNGSGSLQVLTISGLSTSIVGGGVTHSLQTIFATSNAASLVWAIEVDYDHP
jgi:hypothetical protein